MPHGYRTKQAGLTRKLAIAVLNVQNSIDDNDELGVTDGLESLIKLQPHRRCISGVWDDLEAETVLDDAIKFLSSEDA